MPHLRTRRSVPVRAGIAAGVLQRLPRALEKNAVLRIRDRGFTRAPSEEAGVEQVDVGERRGTP